MKHLLLPFAARYILLTFFSLLFVLLIGLDLHAVRPDGLLTIGATICGGIALIGFADLLQTRHAILRNYPIAAHLRFILEEIRPEIRQYFFESEKDGRPFSRDARAVVYQRAKMVRDSRPFGTQHDVYADGFEFLRHSLTPAPRSEQHFRVDVGDVDCAAPYSISIFNISAMSYGALSANAVRALNEGARRGGFAHDTGEGGFSSYHREKGGDIVWEIGSGYFGCRNPDGSFCAEKFAATAVDPQVRMVELKLSQGAKPGHGGVLPAAKVTPEIAAIRGVEIGRDCISPAAHSVFSTPIELLEFIATMRHLSGGKPAGFKLCIGQPWEFLAICKAMLQTGLCPDFIVIDGAEGGTGAAPLEFMDHLGMPLRDGLNFAHNALVGIGMRDRVRLGASGKIVSAFDIARAVALGADYCNAARGFMFALGCIQSLSCHTDRCPTGVATQDPVRARALVVPDKATRVANFHKSTLHALSELVAAAGLAHPRDLQPAHFVRRISPTQALSFAEIYPALREGELIEGTKDERFRRFWDMARAETFAPGADLNYTRSRHSPAGAGL